MKLRSCNGETGSQNKDFTTFLFLGFFSAIPIPLLKITFCLSSYGFESFYHKINQL